MLIHQVILEILEQGKHFFLYCFPFQILEYIYHTHKHTQQVLVEDISHFLSCLSKINQHQNILKELGELQNKNIHKNQNDRYPC